MRRTAGDGRSSVSRAASRCLRGAVVVAWIVGPPAGAQVDPAVSGAEAFETVPDQPVAAILPPALASGKYFTVADPVRSDGLMRLYAIDSRYGKFDAYGRVALETRLHEIDALTQLSNTSRLEVVAGGASHGIVTDVGTVVGVVTHPIATVTGIPRGIVHLFQGYVAQGKEAVAQGKEVAGDVKHAGAGAKPDGGSGTNPSAEGKSVVSKGESAVRTYAERYFGLSAAERRWYQKLGVDPYTNNAPLRDAVHQVARIDAAAGFGMKFVALPEVAGLGIARRALDAIYNEDPAALREHQRAALGAYGLSAAEIDRFQNTLLMSPTRQVMLLGTAQRLDGVAGRAELFRHASELTSETEAEVYLQSVGLLVAAHREKHVRSILPGVTLPAARSADGLIVVCGAFDSVYWTRDVAAAARSIEAALPSDAIRRRELWLTGQVSERARDELAQRGWDVHEHVVVTGHDDADSTGARKL